MDYPIHKGSCAPLGLSRKAHRINFAVYSKQAKELKLLLFLPGSESPFLEVPLQKTNDIWHSALENLPPAFEYAYRTSDGKTLCDPYAQSLNTSNVWGTNHLAYSKQMLRGSVSLLQPFDWESDVSPAIPMKDLIIYEMHIRGFSQDPSSHVKHPGTFLGMIEKIPYLQELGINAVEILPIFEFNENEYQKMNPKTRQRLYNYWGYSTINFFSPMNRYAFSHQWHAAIIEFKTLVKALHKAGIEVILDVVYNHTAEGDKNGPTLSFRGLDNQTYYMIDEEGNLRNYSGCGNTFNCNHPTVQKLILDSLRYWVQEMHVDGFRFDLASILTRDQNGAPLEKPPLISAIKRDPILNDTKLIAEAWDCGGLYQVGSFPGKGRFAEWNGAYRDIVRRFIKGTNGQAGAFSKVLCGSEEIYKKVKNPCLSINFITAHDGFTLCDLVSYQEKHNIENGENNQDGCNHNESWNCGQEGKTSKHSVHLLRQKQMRNFHLALMVSIGTPMILMGDEYAHTRDGNNNTWCQDSPLNWFQWKTLKKNKAFFRFYKKCIAFRKEHPHFKRARFLTETDITWHGHMPNAPNWDSHFVAYTLQGGSNPLYIAFNAHWEKAPITLPKPPRGKLWHGLINTALPSPNDFPDTPRPLPTTLVMEPHSALLAKAL